MNIELRTRVIVGFSVALTSMLGITSEVEGQATGACCWAGNGATNCTAGLTETACENLDGVLYEHEVACANLCTTDLGRCCYWADGAAVCDVTSLAVCGFLGGDWLSGANCGEDVCNVEGRCCTFDDKTETAICSVRKPFDCSGLGAHWVPGDCTTGTCDYGHCCYLTPGGNSACAILVEDDCDEVAGTWMGGVLTHATTTCDAHGRCCSDGESTYCRVIAEEECLGQNKPQDPSAPIYSWTWGADCSEACYGHCCFLDGGGAAKCDINLEIECDELAGIWIARADCKTAPTCDNHGRCCDLSDPKNPTCSIQAPYNCTKDTEFWVWGEECVAADACPILGACCYYDGSDYACILFEREVCTFIDGVWFELEHCDEVDCPPNGCVSDTYGACCHVNAAGLNDCVVEDLLGCEALGGVFGLYQICAFTNCEFGRCCFDDNGVSACAMMLSDECAVVGGVWDLNSNCTTGCPTGSCCMTTGGYTHCEELNEVECGLGGGYWKSGATCGSSGTAIGACCDPIGSCQEIDEENCRMGGGYYMGDASICSGVDCTPPTGACCLSDATCSEVVETACDGAGGFYSGPNTICQPNPCFAPDNGGQVVTMYSTFGGNSMAAYEYWQQPSDAYLLDNSAAIAVKFNSSVGGEISGIHLPIAYIGASPSAPLDGLELFIREDDGGVPKADTFNSTAYARFDVCADSNEGCGPLVATGGIDPTTPLHYQTFTAQFGVALDADTDYWLILSLRESTFGICDGTHQWVWAAGHSGNVVASLPMVGTGVCYADGDNPTILDCRAAPAFRLLGVLNTCDETALPLYADGCDSENPAEFISKCWFGPSTRNQTPQWAIPGGPTSQYQVGGNLNIDLMNATLPPNLPPRKLNPAMSSSPLVSREVTHFGGGTPYRERAAHNGVVDIVTGQPLLQAIDFELPFGSAVFRRTRTYSEIPIARDNDLLGGAGTGLNNQVRPYSQYWDWNGMFWMTGEQPLLLIDSSRQLIEPPGASGVWPAVASHPIYSSEDEVRCILIPDAHHSIPFTKSDTGGNVTYTAPSWYDAKLIPSSQTDAAGRPLFFEAYLHRSSIKYTFEAHYEDLWTFQAPNDPTKYNAHDHPNMGGLGIPYYGLVTKIEDRYGNVVEYQYCRNYQYDCDDPSTAPCQECCQSCEQKGQIRRIKLRTPNEAGTGLETVWTLLYTHRDFGTSPSIDDPDGQNENDNYYGEDRTHRAVHSIHAFEGDVDFETHGVDPAFIQCPTIRKSQFCHADALEELDNIPTPWIPDGWAIEAKFLYSERGPITGCNGVGDCTSNALFGDAISGSISGNWASGWRLHKATVTKRTVLNDSVSSNEVIEDVDYAIYKDARIIESDSWVQQQNHTYLKYVFESRTIDAIIEALKEADPQQFAEANVNTILGNVGSLIVEIEDPTDPSGVVAKPINLLADLSFTHSGTSYYNGSLFPTGALRDSLLLTGSGNDYGAGVNPSLTRSHYGGHSGLVDRRAGSPDRGDFEFYRFIHYPDVTPPVQFNPGVTTESNDQFYSLPMKFQREYDEPWDMETPPHDHDFFLAIVDEVIDRVKYGNYQGGGSLDGIASRRIIKQSPTGFVLSDKTYTFDGTSGVLTSQEGFAETYIFDGDGRVTERRTTGWNSADNADPENEGAIVVYEYNAEGELVAQGYKQGAHEAGTPTIYYTHAFVRHPDRSEFVTEEIEFPTPVTDYLNPSAPGNTTKTYFTFRSSGGPGLGDDPVETKTTVLPPAPTTVGGASTYVKHAELFGRNGNPIWQGSGTFTDDAALTSSATPIEFYLVETERDYYGRPTRIAVDSVGSPPANWPARTPQDGVAPALNHTTVNEYNPVFGLIKIEHPNGRETHIVYRWEENDGSLTTWAFDDLELKTPPSTYKPYAPATVTNTLHGQTRWTEVRKFFGEINLAIINTWTKADPTANPPVAGTYEVVSRTEPEYDLNGRVVGMNRTGSTDGATVRAEVGYDALGNLSKEVAPDGTIKRNIYDGRGRLARVYRGTDDSHAFWSTALPPCACDDPDPNNPDCIAIDEYTDNLTLVEKRYYGEGVNNADRLTQVRYYRDQPANQYFETAPDPLPQGCTVPDANNEDDIGWLELTEYDWRMRPVFTETRNASGTVLAQQVTWYDNLDRVRFNAEYAHSAPTGASVDPRQLDAGDALPTAAQIIAATSGVSDALLSLNEAIYDARGQVEESRQYQVSDTTGATYTSTLTYHGYHGRVVEMHAPQAPIVKNTFDGKARQIRSQSFVNVSGNLVEIHRTESTYDTNDRVISTIDWERKANASGNDLTEANSIRTFVYMWYDTAGRMIASANFGTNNAVFDSPGSTVIPWATSAPALPATTDVDGNITSITSVAGYPDAIVSASAFDHEGNLVASFNPNGSVERSVYDDLGRKIVESIYADSSAAESAFIQRTAYQYDDAGRLIGMAAVLPGFSGSHDDIWSSTADVQVTAIFYGADVVNQGDGSTVSQNNGYIKEVHFPDDVTGQPDPADSIAFTYYADGLVHSRTDARGVVLTHKYDELGRRYETTVDDSALYAGSVPDNEPANRVGKLLYEYEADGLVKKITIQNTSGAIIAENVFTYDANRNLTGDYQQHGAAVDTANSPVVNYFWDFRTATLPTGNYNRLKYIRYPEYPGATAQPPLVPRREVNLIYNSGIDSLLSRVSSITTRAAEAISPHNAALYQYTGLNRRTRVEYGNQTVLDYAVSGVLTGLDAFGRPIDHNWQQPDTSNPGQLGLRSFARYQHGYDTSGNRTFARVMQHTEDEGGANPVAHDNDRSWAYGYDQLNRLVAADFGQLNVANDAVVANSAPAGLPMTTDWLLDSVGNWSGDGTTAGRVQTVDPDGAGPLPVENLPFTHNVLANNELTGISDNGTTTTLIHDVCGNLVADDRYVYLYDGLNRLVEIRPYDPMTVTIDSDGNITSGTLPAAVTTFRYDGLGRLIEIERPIPNSTTVAVWHFYYDGVRRIQEVKQYVSDPFVFETQCEYVYGAGYVDEFILAANPNDDVHYLHQDANYNLIAQTDETGAVMYQSTYSPYGELLAFEQIETDPLVNKLPRLGIGHQGLFHINNEGGGTGAPTTANDTGRYYNRNRWYDAAVGRFTQRDPNGTGALINQIASAGDSPQPQESPLFSMQVYKDGPNLYGALLSNPLSGADALGLARHHFYPMYLGGNPKGPGIELDDLSHGAFHRSLSESLGGSTWKSQREQWRKLTPELRKTYLMEAADAAGLDVTDPSFSALLDESYDNATHGQKMKRLGIPNSNMRDVPKAPKSGAKGLVFGKLKGANKLRVLKYGGSVASAALSVATLAALDIWDPNIQQLGFAGYRARANGGLTIWDEAFALGDFYNLTQDPVSAGYAWREWQRGIDN